VTVNTELEAGGTPEALKVKVSADLNVRKAGEPPVTIILDTVTTTDGPKVVLQLIKDSIEHLSSDLAQSTKNIFQAWYFLFGRREPYPESVRQFLSFAIGDYENIRTFRYSSTVHNMLSMIQIELHQAPDEDFIGRISKRLNESARPTAAGASSDEMRLISFLQTHHPEEFRVVGSPIASWVHAYTKEFYLRDGNGIRC